MIQRHYGNRPFKCGFLNCIFRNHGFETRALRDSHMRHHDKPWKCSFHGCEYQDGGFLSRKMRDEHLDRSHQENNAVATFPTESLDPDEIQPLLFDLVKADNVVMVKGLLKQFESLEDYCKLELRKCAARFGSASMLELIADKTFPGRTWFRIGSGSIDGNNLETFRCLLSLLKDVRKGEWRGYGSIAYLVLDSDLEDIVVEWAKFVDYEFMFQEPSKEDAAQYLYPNAIRTAAGRAHSEQVLCRIWKTHVLKKLSPAQVGSALLSAAQSPSSIELAQTLLDHGAPVDYRGSVKYMTPLHHAARQTTAAAAEFMKFLLFRGADPEGNSQKSHLKIREEKGAKGISKWLGISWDELVAQAKEHLAAKGSGDADSNGEGRIEETE